MVDDDHMLELLESAAPPPPSADDALDQLRPRIRRARRKRAAMRGSAGLVVLALIGGLVSSATDDPSRNVRIGDTGTTVASDSSTTTATPPTTTGSGVGAAPALSPQTGGSAGEGEAGGPPAGVNPASSAAGSPSGPSARSGPAAKPAPSGPATSSPASNAARPPAAPTASVAAHVTTFGSQGGTVEVTYTDSSMSLGSVSPLPGWQVSATAADAASIQVTFEPEAGNGQPVDVEVHLDSGVPVVAPVEETVEETAETVEETVDGAGDVLDVIVGS